MEAENQSRIRQLLENQRKRKKDLAEQICEENPVFEKSEPAHPKDFIDRVEEEDVETISPHTREKTGVKKGKDVEKNEIVSTSHEFSLPTIGHDPTTSKDIRNRFIEKGIPPAKIDEIIREFGGDISFLSRMDIDRILEYVDQEMTPEEIETEILALEQDMNHPDYLALLPQSKTKAGQWMVKKYNKFQYICPHIFYGLLEGRLEFSSTLEVVNLMKVDPKSIPEGILPPHAREMDSKEFAEYIKFLQNLIQLPSFREEMGKKLGMPAEALHESATEQFDCIQRFAENPSLRQSQSSDLSSERVFERLFSSFQKLTPELKVDVEGAREARQKRVAEKISRNLKNRKKNTKKR